MIVPKPVTPDIVPWKSSVSPSVTRSVNPVSVIYVAIVSLLIIIVLGVPSPMTCGLLLFNPLVVTVSSTTLSVAVASVLSKSVLVNTAESV